jgi:Ca2+-binding EF-hand superfamily protein
MASSRDVDGAFDRYAVAGEGQRYLTGDTAVFALQYLGLNPSYASMESLVREMDTNADDRITIGEFRSFVAQLEHTRADRARLRVLFEKLDRDRSGYLEASEFAVLLQGEGEPLSEDEVAAALALADTDGNGRIDVEEFISLLCGADDETPPPHVNATDGQENGVDSSPSRGEFIAAKMDDSRMRAALNHRRKLQQAKSEERHASDNAAARDEEAAFRRAMEEKSKTKSSGCCVVA